MTITLRTIKGFTLLETLASIAILSVSIVGPLAVMVRSSSYARQTKDVITATYLAEEGVELLQNQFDSLYILCKKVPESPTCIPSLTNPAESSGEIAWRVFKQRLSTTVTPSCYNTIDSNGCTYDYSDMVKNGDITVPPTIRTTTDTSCLYIVPITVTITEVDTIASSLLVTVFIDRDIHKYVCSANIPVGAVTENKQFQRKVVVEPLATFEVGVPLEGQYNDDLRITSSVSFKGTSGVTHTVKAIRFMHSRE